MKTQARVAFFSVFVLTASPLFADSPISFADFSYSWQLLFKHTTIFVEYFAAFTGVILITIALFNLKNSTAARHGERNARSSRPG